MNRRTFLRTACAGTVWGRLASGQPARAPNIILILADDLGYGDLGCYGSRLRTPNIDQLASEGVRFTDFYSASSVCTPSRAALLTGRYPVRSGVTGVIQANDSTGLPASETSIARVLKGAGYRTACIGKWHLGSQAQFLPPRHGFDEYWGIPYSNDMWPLPMLHNTEVVEEQAKNENLTLRFTDQAVNFVNQSKDSPFFLYLAETAPHIPLAASEAFRNRSPLGTYGDVVEELDWSVGEVLKAVDNNGLRDNTLVIFMSDNGPWYQGSRGGLRGRKGETYEGGMRVPFIARFPGRIPERSSSYGLATAMDILPTLARVANAPLPGQKLDGIDIWPVLTKERDEMERGPFLYFDGWNLQCARLGPWKLHLSRYSDAAWTPSGPGGRINLPLPRPELFNIADDPFENYDSARTYPEIVADIRKRVESTLSDFPAPVMQAWNETMRHRVQSTPPGALPIDETP
jgi:arylsulfatase